MAKSIPKNVINPFSEAFVSTWELWIAYKWEVHKWKYKGVTSEQMALKHLVDLSGGDEQKAVKIIEQSIRRQWQGFFPLHETASKDGKSKPKQSTPKAGDTKEQRINDVQAELTKRYKGGKEGDGEPHLKAV